VRVLVRVQVASGKMKLSHQNKHGTVGEVGEVGELTG